MYRHWYGRRHHHLLYLSTPVSPHHLHRYQLYQQQHLLSIVITLIFITSSSGSSSNYITKQTLRSNPNVFFPFYVQLLSSWSPTPPQSSSTYMLMSSFHYRYTYGKPVKGTADLRIKSKWNQYNWINNTRVKVSKDLELQFPVSLNYGYSYILIFNICF